LRLRRKVVALIPSVTAASCSVGDSTSTRIICSRSRSSRLEGRAAAEAWTRLKERVRKAFGTDQVALGEHHGAFHSIAQFVHVTRPGIIGYHCLCLW